MAAPFNKRVRILLEKDCEFRLTERQGKVLELRPEGYFIFWEPRQNPDTGECFDKSVGILSYEDIATENAYGQLVVLKRPGAAPIDRDNVRRDQRTRREIARMHVRKAYALAAASKIENGELRDVRDDFEAKQQHIADAGIALHRRMLEAAEGRNKKRGLARKNTLKRQQSDQFEYPESSGRMFFKWYRAWIKGGDDALFDSYRNCGGASRYPADVREFTNHVISKLLDQERPHVNSIAGGVQAAIWVENERRERLPVPEGKMPVPGYFYIRNQIDAIAPADHAIRTRGLEVAYRDMHALGVGVTTSRPLERVEIDEYMIDLMVLLKEAHLFDHLTPFERKLIGLDGSPKRVVLSAAIDVHTRCLLALQIVPEGLKNPLRDTVEMIYLDKTDISDAVGCTFSWHQCGAPEAIVLDRGPKYVTDEAYAILAALGITNLGAPAGKPWLKPFIERVFRTIHSDLLVRLSARTFGNVVDKGENDPAARATLGLDDFLFWLVRWTVDAYHNKRHPSLGMTPAQAWERATRECKPRSLSSREMRLAFGTRTTRKVGPKGIRVMHVDYTSNEFSALRLRRRIDEFEVVRWHGDIGAIEVRVGGGEWMTLPAADEKWISKTETDLRVWLESRRDMDSAARSARANAINDINAASYSLKKLCGLVSMPSSEEDLARIEARFTRHNDTAERRHRFGAYDDILAGVVISEEVSSATEDRLDAPIVPGPDNDLME